jgi:hypothetical protein
MTRPGWEAGESPAVPNPSKQTAPDSVSAGWAEPADGRWEAAKARFEEAFGDAATAEASEGLSWSAWWLEYLLVIARKSG